MLACTHALRRACVRLSYGKLACGELAHMANWLWQIDCGKLAYGKQAYGEMSYSHKDWMTKVQQTFRGRSTFRFNCQTVQVQWECKQCTIKQQRASFYVGYDKQLFPWWNKPVGKTALRANNYACIKCMCIKPELINLMNEWQIAPVQDYYSDMAGHACWVKKARTYRAR